MGNELIMAAVASESIRGHRLPSGERASEHQLVPVNLAEAQWCPPEEPWREHGLDWHKDPKLRRAHLRAVRTSLEAFLNRHLARLHFMLRTGWFVLGEVEVKVTKCRGISDREMRAHFSFLDELRQPPAPDPPAAKKRPASKQRQARASAKRPTTKRRRDPPAG